ncbi:ABC transporter ATP-binding protein [Chloroflexota bacterium]
MPPTWEEEDLLVSLNDTHVHYGVAEVVNGVSMEIQERSITSLLGANGSGKTTILRSISQLKRLTSGEIWFDGHRIDGIAPHKIAKLGVAHVPEGKGIFPYMSVLDNVRVGADVQEDKNEAKRDVEEIYEYFPILKHRGNKAAGVLSGGEQQILAIARTLMLKPKLLLLDEPLQGMAPLVQEEIANIILGLNEKRGLTVLMVEHNVHMALDISHDVYVLDSGKIILHGSPQELTKAEYVQKIYLAG